MLQQQPLITDRVEELNGRIYDRQLPSGPLQANFDIRPVSTKYSHLPILDQRQPARVPIAQYPIFNIEQTFNPGTDAGPWGGFASRINEESDLRNQFFALQRSSQAYYVPASTSDLYQNSVYTGENIQQPFPYLFEKTKMSAFDPNKMQLGQLFFDNCTRQQLKAADVKLCS